MNKFLNSPKMIALELASNLHLLPLKRAIMKQYSLFPILGLIFETTFHFSKLSSYFSQARDIYRLMAGGDREAQANMEETDGERLP